MLRALALAVAGLFAFPAPALAAEPKIVTDRPQVAAEMTSGINPVRVHMVSSNDPLALPLSVDIFCYITDSAGQRVSPGLRLKRTNGMTLPVNGGHIRLSMAGNSQRQDVLDIVTWAVDFQLLFDYQTTWRGQWTLYIKPADVDPANAINEGSPKVTLTVVDGIDPNTPKPSPKPSPKPPTQPRPSTAPSTAATELPAPSLSPAAASEAPSSWPATPAVVIAQEIADPPADEAGKPWILYAAMGIALLLALPGGGFLVYQRRKAGQL